MLNDLRVLCQLVSRDLYVLKRSLVGDLIDGAILVTIQVLTYGYLLPQLGMPATLIAPLFVGSGLFFIIVTRGFAMAMRFAYKAPYEGYGLLNYYLTLPVSPWVMLMHYVVTFVIETALVTLPVFFVGLRFLPVPVVLSFGSWCLLLCVYAQALLFWALYYLATPFLYTFEWFRNNLWPRRLDPMNIFSSVFFPWGAVYKANTMVAYLLLISPSTYIIEGLRCALGVAITPTIPLSICMLVIMLCTLFCWWRLTQAIIKKLDPVLPR